MQGIIATFRGSHKTQYGNQMIVIADGVDSKVKAKTPIGKYVVWTSPGKKTITGKITKEHGNNGALRVLFERGMPGQSVGAKVEIKT